MTRTTEDLLTQAKAHRALPPPAMRRSIREAVGVSQADLAEALDVDPATVSRWESGERQPRGSHLAPYVDLLLGLQKLSPLTPEQRLLRAIFGTKAAS